MGYYLQAIIAPTDAMSSIQVVGSRPVRLGQGMSILPITSALQQELRIDDYPMDTGSPLSAPVMDICAKISERSRAIYVEAAMHGGPTVFQAFLAFENGRKRGPSVTSTEFGALSEGLRFLGVTKGAAFDEFEAVGLDRYRDTNDWVKGDA